MITVYSSPVHIFVVLVCGLIQPPLTSADDDPANMEGRAQVHIVLWLGMASDASNAPVWSNEVAGETVVYAETVSGDYWCLLVACKHVYLLSTC